MKMCLVVILFCLLYSCNGNLLGESKQNSVDAQNKEANITDIKMEVSILKDNYHALLQRVYNNENDVAFLKGQEQQLEHELENTRRKFSCEIEGIREITTQYELELNKTVRSWTTFNETIQNLSHSVSLLDAKYLLLENAESHIIDGKWTAWVEEPCSVTCGVGVRLRHRQCSNPYPKKGGKKCTGNDNEQITCTKPSCLPVDTLECHGGWIKREDFGASYCFSNKWKTWDEAQEQCSTQNASLADIYSEKEAVWLADFCRTHSGTDFWIGGKSDNGIYKWFTYDGKTTNMNYTRWAKDMSHVFTYECAELWEDYEYKWYSYDCDTYYNFICKTVTSKMSDIHSTAYRYEAVCTELNREPHPYIIKMFEREKEDTVLRKKTGDFKDQMHLYLAGNNNLLTDKRIEDPDCEALYKTLQNNSYVTSLDLRYNLITDEGAKFIAKLIEETTKLTDLNLMCNEIGAVGAEHIAKALLKNESLKSLRMTGNKMGNKGGMWFAQALQVNTTLEALDVADTDLTIESIIAISTVLYNNKTLKALNINRPILFSHQEETTVHFAEMLKVNTTLKEIHFQKYDMRDFGMTRLAENLMHNDTLTYLDLSCNRITRDGINELSKVLEKNAAIEVLDLGYNRLEDDGAIHIANALASLNTNLKTLVVTSNNIGSKGLCALADAMKTNTTLTNIYIWGNKLEEPAAIAFANLIDNGRLSKENTDVQAYVVDGATKLCELSHQISRHTYFAPSYGDDVPSWQPRGKNPRGSDVIVVKNLTVY